ncbi:MAG: and RNA helicase protein [Candidatus Uhrbacteria bacterium GW2011_GWE2_45_35]|uniref:And RNA helicase protein n=2 Tax=Candidatus Uhriibacteriota TaxID=1752732 RepID=A0A0G1JGF1_9BACT|nr:MAG: and RNA helicase protein [Candidatus Uhrbacteria bacterium GW2011_GWF2_44_350]KKU07282.1 MAG: and RNA helicase protein [Candidatus Uhrbacteria bacterium GW2011_GWE2_45_35]HBR80427.1 DNA helicase UvrD [Candidatus Uhrbacteria bacterium]HCU31190.1 DNA helicase UvrD [Candidatus Uhrbacteria bacterium]
MRFICDFHIHSKFSRACSKELELPKIAKACERKGINVVATSDWTHPGWFKHIKETLVEKEPGLFVLKDGSSPTRFILTTETSHVYKRGGQARRVHLVVFAPSIEAVEKVNKKLEARKFNLKADGRPILGFDCENYYSLLKEIDERIIIVPAHAWTPWFSVFGSKSGFDSLEECFGKLTPEIFAIETGLSSDPLMNWRLSALDKVVLVSNSDAHSLDKLGREANVFEIEKLSYDEIVRILREQDKKRFLYTIEFFPEEGKYHFDGCADCGFSCRSKESKKYGGRCPKCKKLLTLGVENRVDALADREAEVVAQKKIPYKSIVPLKEIIAEAYGVGSASKKIKTEYEDLINNLGNEFSILLDVSEQEIGKFAKQPLIAKAVTRMRSGKIDIKPGYDGVFGKIKIFSEAERKKSVQSRLL